MNLSRSIFLLSDDAQEYLRMLYRRSMIADTVQLNFLSAALGISAQSAAETAEKLHEIGLIRYEKYGRLSLTEDGKAYGKTLVEKRPEILEKR